jgi:predicted SnoaL-like aldol condensation-catalyzing enzyme
MMKDNTEITALFDRWEKVWHEGQDDLAKSCIGDQYIRHDETGTRTVSGEGYAAEVAAVRKERPDFQTVVYDHIFDGNRAWFRFSFNWTDVASGKPRSRAGLQTYRIEGGRLVETWISMQPMDTDWPDAVAQERWTSPPAIK